MNDHEQLIYLDYNATTPIAPPVVEAMLPYLTEHYGNPSSSHALGLAAREAVALARRRVAALLAAAPEEIVFTGGGSESNNLAIQGALLRGLPVGQGHLVISAVEHPAVTEPARFLERLGYAVTVVPCDAQGVVSPAAVADVLRDDTRLVSIMHANNEVGVIQPIAEIAAICRRRGVLIHTDAAQSAGKLPLDVGALNVDLLTIAGHKLYAPKGVGALYVREGVRLEPLIHGAGHESGRRAGTENVPYIVGLGRAAELAVDGGEQIPLRLRALRDHLAELLQAGIGEKLSINGADAERLPNTLSVNFPDVEGQALLAACPTLCASTGSACHSGTTIRSATLAAMDLPEEVARGTVRLSLGWYTEREAIEAAAAMLIDAWKQRGK